MFGLNKMYREREQLYMRCQRARAQADEDRALAKQKTLDAVSSTKGLLVSFVLGLTTQCDAAQQAHRSVLKGVQNELLGVINQYLAARFQAPPESPSETKD
ncbi:hypothetical protein MAQ5080_02307 [Marinomonas aquimarina]|uniref:Uncharacterized protein n=1 Tax=Marinomonas aquimarina TaxID=295068 RepID=A0A1A8TK18_9GAMM|nr:hypothetical protein [Marinomonas aquimarina]SBS32624.1 hypothetical protein MAQ5080_02307 [Marinomonas aquimarina]